jgi:predicted dehydrogenase
MSGVVWPGPAVALAGLGRVGAHAPLVAMPDGRPVFRNHLDAVQVAGGRVVSLVDPSAERRMGARARLPGHAPVAEVSSIGELVPGTADIVTVATPPEDRLEALRAALALRPKAILLEKPLSGDMASGAELVRTAKSSSVPVFVAYNRRTDPGMRAFAEGLAVKDVRRAVFYYGSGLVNYASHAVDSLLAWFGPVVSVQAVADGGSDPDRGCVSFNCMTAFGLTVHVIGLPDVNYDVFEADIFLADARIGYRNNGAEKFRYQARADLYYPGYPGLVEVPQGMARPIGGFVEMYRMLFNVVESRAPAPLLCTVAQAFEVQRVIEAVMRSAKDRGRVVGIDPAGIH